MTTTPLKAADHRIQENVVEELKWSPEVEAAEVGVSVLDTVVTLSGQVDNFAQRNHARVAAARVKGVTVVANDLTVRTAFRAQPSDTDVAIAVREAISWSANLPQGRVQGEVRNHVVVLTGSLDWNYQRHDAGMLVRGLLGVRGVENRIRLSPRVSATGTAKLIKAAMVRHAALDADAITVTSSGSEITLSGTVASWPEKKEAARSAWGSPHVTAVHNELLVSSS